MPKIKTSTVGANTAYSLHLDDFLPYRLSVLTNAVSRNLARMYADRFNLTIAEWRILAHLGQHSNITASEAAERTGMDKVRVSRAVTRLANAGHIVRRTDPCDKRQAQLKLSRSGLTVYQRIVPLALQYERDLLLEISAEDYRQLNQLIDRLNLRANLLANQDE